MRKVYNVIIIILLFILSCKNHTERSYYPSGKLKNSVETQNGQYNGNFIAYYENGKIRMDGLYLKGKKNGWFTTYDSIYSKKISEKYYSKGKLFTHVDYDIDGKCTYYYMHPELITNSDDDTLYLKRTDSLEIVFHQRDTLLKIKDFLVRTNPVFYNANYAGIRNKEISDIITVRPIKNKNFVHFDLKDEYFIFGNDTGRLFHEYYNVGQICNEEFCDSLDISSLTSIYYYRLN